MNDGYEVLKDNGELYAIKKTNRWHSRFIGKYKDYKSPGKLLPSIPNEVRVLFYDIQRNEKKIDADRFYNKKFASCVRTIQNELVEVQSDVVHQDDDTYNLVLWTDHAVVGEYNYPSKEHAIEDIELANDISNLTIIYQ
jgi:hypothetical protein